MSGEGPPPGGAQGGPPGDHGGPPPGPPPGDAHGGPHGTPRPPQTGHSYATTVAGKQGRKKLNILDIIFERKDNQVSFHLSKDELAKLLFVRMKLDPKHILKIDTSGFGKINIELASNLNPENYLDLPAFEIRKGLSVKYYKPHHRKDVLVNINWLDIETPDELLVHVLSHFGKVKSNVTWIKMKEEKDESQLAKMLNSIRNGDRQVWMEIMTPVPSYAMIDNRKIKIHYAGQKRTCARCHKGADDCRGNSNAKLCDDNGGEKANLKDAWKEVLESVNYTDWNGGEITETENEEKDEALEEDIEIHDNCDGIVVSNLVENNTLDDIQEMLKGLVPDDALREVTVHPTGSTRSKIIKNVDKDGIRKIIGKLNNKTYKGRILYCRQNVTTTPVKQVKDVEPNTENVAKEVKTTIPTGAQPKLIPGLPDEDIKKSLEKQKRKDEKARRKAAKEDKEKAKTLSLLPEDILKTFNFEAESDEVFDNTVEGETGIASLIGTPKSYSSLYAKILNSPIRGEKRGSTTATLSPQDKENPKMIRSLKTTSSDRKSSLPTKT